jgi:hypothetical protein
MGEPTLPNCVTCGRFTGLGPGTSWRMVYSGGPIPMPDHEQIQCRRCTDEHGPLPGQSGIRPECASGVIPEPGESDGLS